MSNENTEEPKATYQLSVDLQVLKHLGIGLYSNLPSVVSEMVANAYDADATTVEITIAEGSVVILDDGNGMDVKDANERFLTVGYDKRTKESPGENKPLRTIRYDRLPMGRKGIGKLSTFAIANEVKVESTKICFDKDANGNITNESECGASAFLMKVSDIEKEAKAGNPYFPQVLDPSSSKLTKGTRITLSDLKRKRGINADFVKKNLARRFAVFGSKFKVSVNGDEVTINDRQYWDKLQFVWGLGENNEFNKAKAGTRVKNADALANAPGTTELLTNSVTIPSEGVETVSGWIGTVHLPKDLKDDNLDNNGIVVMARGKLVHENLLPFARTGMVFSEYIVGEIEADWLDTDSEDDIATSDRQNLKEDDPRFGALQTFLKDRLNQIAVCWDTWRKAVGKKEAIERHPALKDWLDSLTTDNRKQAEKLISTIEGMPVSDDDAKKELFKHGIMAFETLALRGNIAALDNFSTVSVDDFRVILDAMSELDSAHYYQIAKNRLAVLDEFRKLVNEGEKEKLVQEKIFNNIWLMDPSWERPTADADMEKRFATKLDAEKLGFSKNEELSRFDIKYLTVSGKDLLVELKKGDRKLTFEELIKQVRKYHKIMSSLARSVDPDQTPNFEIIVLVGELPNGYSKEDADSLKPYNARIMTYNKLIEHAKATYKEYLDAQENIAKIQTIVDSL